MPILSDQRWRLFVVCVCVTERSSKRERERENWLTDGLKQNKTQTASFPSALFFNDIARIQQSISYLSSSSSSLCCPSFTLGHWFVSLLLLTQTHSLFLFYHLKTSHSPDHPLPALRNNQVSAALWLVLLLVYISNCIEIKSKAIYCNCMSYNVTQGGWSQFTHLLILWWISVCKTLYKFVQYPKTTLWISNCNISSCWDWLIPYIDLQSGHT